MYLVIKTKNKRNEEFTHFINLNKDEIEEEIKGFLKHLNYFPGQEITKVYYSQKRLTNW